MEYPIRDFHQNEWAFFFKDDWKIHPDLTLNLGLRWDYYGVPFIKSGMTAGLEGGGAALFGISGRSWEEAFWQPGDRSDLTRSIFVGPNSPNSDSANYHSLQAQVTLRPTHGISLTGTYTWSKNLGYAGTETDPLNRRGDYTVLAGNRSHVFVTYGTFQLPFGPGQKFGSSSTGVLARLIENWEGSWILNLRTGTPLSVTAQSMLYANGVPDMVGQFDFDSVGVYWPHGAAAGNYFANKYHTIKDPQCSSISADLQSICTLQAIADDTGQVIFQNPRPGTQGNFGRNRMDGPGEWTLDMAMSKGVRITESTNFQIRLDANNLFNHPVPSYQSFGSGMRIIVAQPPIVDINNANPFGYLDNKVGTRTFQITARVNF